MYTFTYFNKQVLNKYTTVFVLKIINYVLIFNSGASKLGRNGRWEVGHFILTWTIQKYIFTSIITNITLCLIIRNLKLRHIKDLIKYDGTKKNDLYSPCWISLFRVACRFMINPAVPHSQIVWSSQSPWQRGYGNVYKTFHSSMTII